MIEIPESTTISQQANEVLRGKVIAQVIEANSPHRFTFYNGDPADYNRLLAGKTVIETHGYGAFVDILLTGDTHLLIGDGANMRYYTNAEKAPAKYQLLVIFADDSFLAFTVARYGAIYAFQGEFDNPYYQGSIHKRNPLDENFDKTYFMNLLNGLKKDMSAKAFLATEQRIPGLGNGTLQDILFNAGIHPKRKVSTLSDEDVDRLFDAIKTTIAEMTLQGGRDTEKGLHGAWGNYRVILCKNTLTAPCPVCGEQIRKEAYLGGAIYYCPNCQPSGK